MKQSSQTFNAFKLSEDALAIQSTLSNKIQNEISLHNGEVSFSKFMQMALYEPALGYYQNNLHKFGEKGDFITAPEMGSSFAYCLANSLVDYFQESKAKDKVLLEIGAGSGALAVNLILAFQKLKIELDQYLILEPSAELQAQQKSWIKYHLPEQLSKIVWLSELPENFQGIMIANEVADAIPCERIKKINGQWCQQTVKYNKQQFEANYIEIGINGGNEKIPDFLKNHLENYPEGYITEYRPLISAWIKSLSNSMTSGALLLIDYGYGCEEFYHPQRVEGSLNCFIRHHSHDDPFQFVGLQDITAHVDFSQIAHAAYAQSFDVEGYTTQAGFLLENGITEINQELSEQDTPEQRVNRSKELQQLLMPGEMGEVIKVILLSKNCKTEINGFSFQDHLHRL